MSAEPFNSPLLDDPVFLEPKVFDNNVKAIHYDLPSIVNCLDWNTNLLAYGHDDGITVLTPTVNIISKNLPTLFQQEYLFQVTHIKTGQASYLIKFTSKYLLTAQEDYSLRLFDHLESETKVLGGRGGHSADVNGIDVSPSGIVASVADDRLLLIWENGVPSSFQLNSIGKVVKFWEDGDGDKVIVVEAGNVIRVLDWRKNQWLYSIYPGQFGSCSDVGSAVIRDVTTINDHIIVTGNGWWKSYDPTKLKGGTGYTPATEEGRLNGWPRAAKLVSGHEFAAGLSRQQTFVYNLRNRNTSPVPINVMLPSNEISAAALNRQANIIAVAHGPRLILASTRD